MYVLLSAQKVKKSICSNLLKIDGEISFANFMTITLVNSFQEESITMWV